MDAALGLLSTLARAGVAIADAVRAKDIADQARALAELDAAIAEVHPGVAALYDEVAKNRADAEAALDKRFPR